MVSGRKILKRTKQNSSFLSISFQVLVTTTGQHLSKSAKNKKMKKKNSRSLPFNTKFLPLCCVLKILTLTLCSVIVFIYINPLF